MLKIRNYLLMLRSYKIKKLKVSDFKKIILLRNKNDYLMRRIIQI